MDHEVGGFPGGKGPLSVNYGLPQTPWIIARQVDPADAKKQPSKRGLFGGKPGN
jgi:hypothetical protein